MFHIAPLRRAVPEIAEGAAHTMQIHEMIEEIETKEQFLEFLTALKRDSASGDGWENGQIETFLNAPIIPRGRRSCSVEEPEAGRTLQRANATEDWIFSAF